MIMISAAAKARYRGTLGHVRGGAVAQLCAVVVPNTRRDWSRRYSTCTRARWLGRLAKTDLKKRHRASPNTSSMPPRIYRDRLHGELGLSWEGQARLADGRRWPRVQRPVHSTRTALLNPCGLELCFHCDPRQLIILLALFTPCFQPPRLVPGARSNSSRTPDTRGRPTEVSSSRDGRQQHPEASVELGHRSTGRLQDDLCTATAAGPRAMADTGVPVCETLGRCATHPWLIISPAPVLTTQPSHVPCLQKACAPLARSSTPKFRHARP